MIIERKLKHVSFAWSSVYKTLAIVRSNSGSVQLSRIEMFSLARFILRAAQHGKTKKKKNESGDSGRSVQPDNKKARPV